MPRIALQLHPDFVVNVCNMMNVEPNANLFGDGAYAVIEVVSPTEFNMKLMTSEEIFEVAKTDSDLQIVSV